MTRALLVAGLVTGCMWLNAPDLMACGDKFLRIGSSTRYRAYAAAYPASILIYKPVNSVAAAIKDLESMLKRAGHKFRAVDNLNQFTEALAAASYDLVLVDVSDAPRIEQSMAGVTSTPEILPIIYKPTKTAVAAAEDRYVCVIKAPGTQEEALSEIDHKMELRRKANVTTAKSRK